MEDMLSRARFDDKDDIVSEDEEVDVDFFEATNIVMKIFVHRRKHEQREQKGGVHRCTRTCITCKNQ